MTVILIDVRIELKIKKGGSIMNVKDMDIQFGLFTYHPEKGELVNNKTGEVSQYK